MLNKITDHFMPEITLGKENQSLPDVLCALLLAISPIVQHYSGIGPVDAGDGLLVLCAVYLAYRFLRNLPRIQLRDMGIVIPLLIYYVYRVIDHGTNAMEIIEALAVCGYLVAAAAGCINVRYLVMCSYVVAMAASICIMLQYFCFFVLGFHLQLVCTTLLRPASAQWILCAQTGLAGITGVMRDFYRPSAFFLEPSHMFLYLIPHFFLLLLSPDKRRWKWISALILSIGLSFSTSGMGILVVAGVWLLYVGCSRGEENEIRLLNVFHGKRILMCVGLVVLYVVLYMTLPFIHGSVSRIFGDGGTNAIDGRVVDAWGLIEAMRGRELAFGVADSTAHLDANMAGFHGTMYKYGIVGVLLSYVIYVRSAVQLDAQYRWMAVIVLLVSYFSTHTHATFYMLYYTFILLSGFYARKERGDKGLAPL